MIVRWPFVLLGVFYLLIGVIHAMTMAFLSGRRSRYGGVDGMVGFLIVCFWPITDCAALVVFVIDKLEVLLELCRKRGAESAMPPKDEIPDRRVD